MAYTTQIYCPDKSNDIFVSVDNEKIVSTWSFEQKIKVSKLNSIYEHGGLRLAVTPTEIPVVIAGAYDRYGICGYHALTGEPIWQRKDLKKVQVIRWIPSDEGTLVGAGFDMKSFVILNALTGETVTTLRGVREVYIQYGGGYAIQATDSEVRLCSYPDWKVVWKKQGRLGRAAFSDDQLVLILLNRTICFDLNGQELWHLEEWFLEITWNQHLGHWFGVKFSDNREEGVIFFQIDSKGNIISQKIIGRMIDCSFMGEGSLLVTSKGKVLSIPDLNVVWDME